MADSPIAKQRDKDIILMRKILLGIIEDDEVNKKDRIEAAKLLSRLHHSLQVSRETAKPSDSDKFIKKMPELKPEQKERLQVLLDGVQSVRH